MAEVEITFKREKLEGIVPVGTYLIDAAKRFGIHFEDVCSPEAGLHHCSLEVKASSDLLSAETKAEAEYFGLHGRTLNERLACQVKFDKAGEVTVMTKEKVVEEPVVEATEADRNEQYRKEFTELPLEKKIANLVRLETIAFGETVSFIMNSPFEVANKLMDVMAEFGFRKEEQQKEATRPEEHKAGAVADDPDTSDDVVESEEREASKEEGAA